MQALGKMLLVLGVVLAVAGGVLIFLSRFDLPFGRLPGDMFYRGKSVTVFAPLGTMFVVSVALTMIVNVLARFWK